MKGQLKASTPKQYIELLDEPRKSEVRKLDALIRKTVPQLEPVIQSGMLAYGPIRYRYASGREGDAARLAVASNASAISLYSMGVNDRGWVAEQYRERLPKAKIGKSCVRFQRVSDLDEKILVALLKESATSAFPGQGVEVDGMRRGKKAAARSPSAKKPARKAGAGARARAR